MSNARETDERDLLGLESGLEALKASPEFRGPVESLEDDHHAHDHFALIYENQRELFAAAVPFMRQGLERGERCMYIADENSEAEVLAAMRARGVDVDAALDSGALTIHTKQDTYLRDGDFDPDDMISFLEESIEESIEEYEALRVAGEMTWVFGDEPDVADLIEYEGKLNRLFPDVDGIALCQYNRDRFPAEVLRDIVRTHPHLVYDNAVCHNVYYTPPEEFFGPERPDNEVDRMLRTLLDRTEAKVSLQERERYLRRQNEVTADPNASFEEKLQQLFELGCERFDLELGAMARIYPDADRIEVEHVSDDHEHLQPGTSLPLSETYCEATAERRSAVSVTDPDAQGYGELTVNRTFGIKAYLGAFIEVDGGPNRTFFFVSSEPREDGFSDDERTFQRLMGQWVTYELEQKAREERLAALNALSRELMESETATEIAELVADAAQGSLGLPRTVVALYDEREGVLRQAAETPAAESLPTESLLELGAGLGWEAFVQTELCRERIPHPDAAADEELEVAALPLGDSGVLLTATAAADGFSPARVDFVQTVAANANAALDRADREQQLHAREETLQEQNGKLERLERINTTIRSIDQALVGASTRTEIERVVCRQLADAGPYGLAWVGRRGAGGVTVEEWAGSDGPDAESALVGGPTAEAATSGEVVVVDDVVGDSPFDEWRTAMLERGYRTAIALPLSYDDTQFGVLTVYAAQSGVFDDLEGEVLAELGDTIAHAINAVESKKALVSDRVAELELTFPGPNYGAVEMTRELDCELVYESVVPRTDGGLRGFFSVRGADIEDVRSFVPRLPVTRVELVTEYDRDGEQHCLFEADLAEESFVATSLDHGGRVQDVTVDADGATATVVLATDASVREFVEMLRAKYDGAELVAKHTRERSQQTMPAFQAELTENLTPRQMEALQTAYFSGYFEEPRSSTGGDIAASMDISQPTFNHHLRTAQRKLFGQLFEESEP